MKIAFLFDLNACFAYFNAFTNKRYTSTKKRAEGDPAALQLPDVSIDNFVGEEAPEACGGPRSPDVFYRGEGARSGPEKPPDNG